MRPKRIALILLPILHPTTAEPVLPIPFEVFKICIFSPLRKAEVAYAVILLGYGKAFLNFL